jgi:hypothetical protein
VTAEKRLRIYLNDHAAGSLTGYELAKRCLSNNKGTDLGDFLRSFVAQLEDERADLKRLMESLGFPEDKLKEGMGWAAEKAGRLKLNGQFRGYSPLSRVLELEGLVIGVTGKRSLWRSVKEYGATDPRVGVIDVDRLEQQAQTQLEELEKHRLKAAKKAFTAD